MYNSESIRLIGIRLDNLTENKIKQVSLFDKEIETNIEIDKIIDNINAKYGDIIKKASIIKYKK